MVYFLALTVPLWTLGLLAMSRTGMNLSTIRFEAAALQARIWANYFCLGPVSPGYRAVERHARKRLRQWLCAKHSCEGRQASSFHWLDRTIAAIACVPLVYGAYYRCRFSFISIVAHFQAEFIFNLYRDCAVVNIIR